VDRFCELLREKYETTVVPGSFFEMPEHFRVGMATETTILAEGLQRLGSALDEFSGRGAASRESVTGAQNNFSLLYLLYFTVNSEKPLDPISWCPKIKWNGSMHFTQHGPKGNRIHAVRYASRTNLNTSLAKKNQLTAGRSNIQSL